MGRALHACGLVLACLAWACNDTSFLDGKLCDPDHRCLPGYQCDPGSNRCLRELPPDGGDGQDGEDGDDGDGGVEVPEPIVLHRFLGEPAGGVFRDLAPLPPEVNLAAAPREPVGLRYLEDEVDLQGGRLEASGEDSRALVEALLGAGSFSLEVWADPAATVQRGPARIVTLSASHVDDGLGLGQEGNDLVGWVRSEASGPDANVSPLALLEQAFPAGRPRHMVLIYAGESGLGSLYVDGLLEDSSIHTVGEGAEARPALLDWNAESFTLGLGDEADGEHAWRGTVQRLAVWALPLDAAQAAKLYADGPGGP
ncbi:MAG TPA: hypothetical protein PK668_25720 [Myxococcota bacterium]|nr:hypothetical protein [Myxococcota bacterium]HRY96927.1 hypothetical protein [Myxococcota bacterium]HSA24044.1 hypothetical protein [Myxococcota bacterium]